MALCEGEIDGIGRVWADGRLMELNGVAMRVHRGGEDQRPDPLIEAVEGVAPAYRGTAYVVFEDLPLGPYGNRVPQLLPVSTLAAWLAKQPAAPAGTRLLLSLRPHSPGLREAVAPLAPDAPITLLSGPEGGLSPAEEEAALASGFVAVSLGQRTLRAETAALAALAALLL